MSNKQFYHHVHRINHNGLLSICLTNNFITMYIINHKGLLSNFSTGQPFRLRETDYFQLNINRVQSVHCQILNSRFLQICRNAEQKIQIFRMRICYIRSCKFDYLNISLVGSSLTLTAATTSSTFRPPCSGISLLAIADFLFFLFFLAFFTVSNELEVFC